MAPDRWYFGEVVPEDHRPGMTIFLNHSDCEGELTPAEAEAVAGVLEWAADRMSEPATGHLARFGSMGAVARRFAEGCRAAAAAGETVEFR